MLFPGITYYPAVILMYVCSIVGLAAATVVIYVYMRSGYFKSENPIRRVFIVYSTATNFILCLHGVIMIVTLTICDRHTIPKLPYNITCTLIGMLTIIAMISDIMSYPIQAYDRVIKLIDPLHVERHLTIRTIYWLLVAATAFAAIIGIFPVVFTSGAYSNNEICLPFYSLSDPTTTAAVITFIAAFLSITTLTTLIDVALIAVIYRSIRLDIENCTTEECRTTKYGVLRKLAAQACEDLVVVIMVVMVLVLLTDSHWGLGLILIIKSSVPVMEVYTVAFKQKTFLNETRKLFYKRRLISFES